MIVEWTNQHGCGGNDDTNPSKLNCDITIQYMIPEPKYDDAFDPVKDDGRPNKYTFRDGTSTGRQKFRLRRRRDDKAKGKKATEQNTGYLRCFPCFQGLSNTKCPEFVELLYFGLYKK